MSSRTFTEWIAYARLEPFGGELTDIHFARLHTTMIDIKRPKNSVPTDLNKFRIWKQIKQEFEPGKFYDRLKDMLKLRK